MTDASASPAPTPNQSAPKQPTLSVGKKSVSVNALLEYGATLHREGHFSEAETIYRAVLERVPDNSNALHLLGVIANQMGAPEKAIPLIERAISINPAMAEAHANLGNAYLAADRPDDAIIALEEAVALKPDHIPALNSLGNALRALRRFEEAIDQFSTALELDPSHLLARMNRANAMMETGDFEDAVPELQRVTRQDPASADAYFNLGIAYRELRRHQEARDAFELCAEIDPKRSEAHFEVGYAEHKMARLFKAQTHYRIALEVDAENVQARAALTKVLIVLGVYDKALEECKIAIDQRPDIAELWVSLGKIHKKMGAIDDAMEAFDKALELSPSNPTIHSAAGAARQAIGDLEKAEQHYREALRLSADDDSYDDEKNLLFLVLNKPNVSSEDLFKWHRDIRAHRQIPGAAEKTFPDRDRDPNRRLRVGYISSDFKTHVVSLNLLPFVGAHDRDEIELFFYSEVLYPDRMTTFYKKVTDHWRDTVEKTDAEVAALIEEDEIDILVVLAGRFNENRPTVVIHRPAPIQVSFHDCATSGLVEMDYWLTDNLLNPPDTPERFTEELYRLPVFYQYPEQNDLPEIGPLPARSNGYVTFGCFNKPEKINDEVVELWARVLKAVPDSRLVLKYFSFFNGPMMTERWRTAFADHGIDPDRIILQAGNDNRRSHLHRYDPIDIALDPFPFNGATTTFEALSMGVPVVSLIGKHFVDRVAYSIAAHIGHPELAAKTKDEYVAIATQLAGNLDHLADLRTRLRDDLTHSPVCQGEAYGRSIERAYRDMWQRWCKGEKPVPNS